jgi:hypothetical protein
MKISQNQPPVFGEFASGGQGAPWHGGPIRPFGPTEDFFKEPNRQEMLQNVVSQIMHYNLHANCVSKPSIALLNFLPSHLLTFYPSFFNPPHKTFD